MEEVIRNILVIYTGGTIGMLQNEETGALIPYNFDHLSKHIPELSLYPHNLEFYCFDPLIDSSDMNPEFWKNLAKVVEENYLKYDGFVILHGTDTMAYTASVLSFMFKNLNKPVILTGSQLPMGILRTDGRENFLTAIELAALHDDKNKPVFSELCVYFENKLFRGNRITKFNSRDFNAFISGNYPPLAEIGIDIEINYNFLRVCETCKNEPLEVSYDLEENIALLKLYPGITQQVVHTILNIKGLKGVIIETFGSGNAPSAQWFINELKSAIDKNIILYNVTQCKEGGVDAYKYQAGLQLENIGVISGYDITTESALAKMMYLLANVNDINEVKKYLKISLRGEISTYQ